jgi:hypothetical protein
MTQTVQQVEQLFFEQMKFATQQATNPVRMARAKLQAAKSAHARASESAFLRSFDYQFSDRWVRT